MEYLATAIIVVMLTVAVIYIDQATNYCIKKKWL
jgi:hypothetical protein